MNRTFEGKICSLMLSLMLAIGPAGAFAEDAAPAAAAPAATPAAPAPGDGAAGDLPTGALTVGFLAGEGEVDGFGDVLIPVFVLDSGLVFVNPRGIYSSESEAEFNIGLGYRHLFANPGLIAGANVYYDYRSTAHRSSFNQVGFGLEVLSDWVDARANYYLPAEKQVLVNEDFNESVLESYAISSRADDPFATGNVIKQNSVKSTVKTTTTTLEHYAQYEQPMRGFDCEVGFGLPIPRLAKYADIRVYGGYYSFDSDYSPEDISGFRGRVQVRTLNCVYIDGELYADDDLYGSSYYIGARAVLPFDIGNITEGKNPFDGLTSVFKTKQERLPLSARLTEMVMRDRHVQTEVSELTEVVEDRVVTTDTTTEKKSSVQTLATDIIFVDQDNASGVEDGTAEHPFNSMAEGVSAASWLVYVWDAADTYNENITVTPNLILWGNGCKYTLPNGARFGSGIYPVVDGRSLGPTIRMSDNSTVAGLYVLNTDQGGAAQVASVGGHFPDIRRVGVFANNVTNYLLQCNVVQDCRYGLLAGVDSVLDTTFVVRGNHFLSNDEEGALVLGVGSSGSLRPLFENNEYVGNEVGIGMEAYNFDRVSVTVLGDSATGNSGYGFRLNADIPGTFDCLFSGVTANHNQSGIGVQANSSSEDVFSAIHASEAVGNTANGVWQSLSATNGSALALVGPSGDIVQLLAAQGLVTRVPTWTNMTGSGLSTLSGNGGSGAFIGIDAAYVAAAGMFDIRANTNTGDGVSLVINSRDGAAVAMVGESAMGMDLASFVFNVATNIMGSPPFPVPLGLGMLPDIGPVEMNGNRLSGLTAVLTGDELAIFAGMGIQANDSVVGSGMQVMQRAAQGASVFGLVNAEASRNNGTGVFNAQESDNLAVGVLANVTANDSRTGYGVGMTLNATQGVAAAVVGSTRSLFAVTNFLGDVGVDLPELPFESIVARGPSVANGNRQGGVWITALGTVGAGAAIVDLQANNNSNAPGAAADVEGGGPAVAMMLAVEADNNLGSGLRLTATSHEGPAFAGLGNVSADNNRGMGIVADVSASNSVGGVLMASERSVLRVMDLYDLVSTSTNLAEIQAYLASGMQGSGPNTANGNDTAGVMVSVQGDESAFAGVADLQADRNRGLGGVYVDLDGGTTIGALVGVSASSNFAGGAGMALSQNSTRGAAVALLSNVRADFNTNGIGIGVSLDASNDTAVVLMASERAVLAADALIDTLDSSTNVSDLAPLLALSLTGLGPNSANGNGMVGATIGVSARDVAVGGILDLQANDTAMGPGVVLNLEGTETYAVLAAIQASDNAVYGIIVDEQAQMRAGTVLGNFSANDNGLGGVVLGARATNGDAYAFVATERSAYLVAQMAEQAWGASNASVAAGIFDLPLVGAGPNTVNGNEGNGLTIDLNAPWGTLLGVFDVQAIDNGSGAASGVSASLTSHEGESFAAFGMVNASSNGIDGIAASLDSEYAGMVMVDVIANDNTFRGIDVSIASTNNAFFGISSSRGLTNIANVIAANNDTNYAIPDTGGYGPLEVSRNGMGGLYASVLSLDGDAAVVAHDIVANNNGGIGVMADVNSVQWQSLAALVGITAVSNAQGIYAGVTAGEDAEAYMAHVVANNSSNGAGVEVSLTSTNGEALAVLSGIDAARNSEAGVSLAADGLDSSSAALTGIAANNNAGDGVTVSLTSDGGDVGFWTGTNAMTAFDAWHGSMWRTGSIAMLAQGGVTANNNQGAGVSLTIDSGDDAVIAVQGIVARGNTNQAGLSVTAEAYNFVGLFDHNTSSGNETGFEIGVDVGNNLTVCAERNVFSSNVLDGVSIPEAATFGGGIVVLDFGGLGVTGFNSIYGNGRFDFTNGSAHMVSARANWWGTNPPAPAKFSGPVTWTNWLTSDPNVP